MHIVKEDTDTGLNLETPMPEEARRIQGKNMQLTATQETSEARSDQVLNLFHEMNVSRSM